MCFRTGLEAKLSQTEDEVTEKLLLVGSTCQLIGRRDEGTPSEGI